jgi:hypothetical protein
MARITPEQQIANRVKAAGTNFLKSRREFAAASAQEDSVQQAKIPAAAKQPQGKVRNTRLLPKGVAQGPSVGYPDGLASGEDQKQYS